MSRIPIYDDGKLLVIMGDDHVLGKFFQMYDKEIITPDGESIVLDWSEGFGYSTNLTGIPNQDEVEDIIAEYVLENGDKDTFMYQMAVQTGHQIKEQGDFNKISLN